MDLGLLVMREIIVHLPDQPFRFLIFEEGIGALRFNGLKAKRKKPRNVHSRLHLLLPSNQTLLAEATV